MTAKNSSMNAAVFAILLFAHRINSFDFLFNNAAHHIEGPGIVRELSVLEHSGHAVKNGFDGIKLLRRLLLADSLNGTEFLKKLSDIRRIFRSLPRLLFIQRFSETAKTER